VLIDITPVVFAEKSGFMLLVFFVFFFPRNKTTLCFLTSTKRMDLLDIDNDWQLDVAPLELRSSGMGMIFCDLSTSNGTCDEALSNSDEFLPASTPQEESSDVSTSPEAQKATTKRKASKATASRKRKTTDVGNSITLTRDVLLTISSEEFDVLVNTIGASRRLSEAENKEVRRQKRLIKNRESAALSRNRKKQALETLEVENQKLKQELSLMKTFLEQTNQLGAFMSSVAAPLGASRGSVTGLMFVLILSFGLFVNLAPFQPLSLSSSSSSSSPASCAVAAGPNLRQLFSLSNSNVLLMTEENDHDHNHANITTTTPIRV
jgi:hypothetical protein